MGVHLCQHIVSAESELQSWKQRSLSFKPGAAAVDLGSSLLQPHCAMGPCPAVSTSSRLTPQSLVLGLLIWMIHTDKSKLLYNSSVIRRGHVQICEIPSRVFVVARSGNERESAADTVIPLQAHRRNTSFQARA